jgi:Na+/H+ antiporter NhaD/arsenite permease-like protein
MSEPAAGGRKFGPAVITYVLAIVAAIGVTAVTGAKGSEGFGPFGGSVPLEFVFFVLILLGVALFHHHTLKVALCGLAAVSLYKAFFGPGFGWLGHHMVEEWQVVFNKDTGKFEVGAATSLLGLLLGFALLAKFFEETKVPAWIPRILPDKGFWGGFVLLIYVWFLSSFLDNIAAAMIGGVIALSAFRGKVCVGYVAAIVAASNAGGAWSVLGDTTTTMMWIDGVPALNVAHGIVASVVALLVFGPLAGAQQQKYSPIVIENKAEKVPIDGASLFIVILILAGAIAANFMLDFPALGVWAAILVGAMFRKPAWGEIPGAVKGAIFLISLVLCASMMPVKALPSASPWTAFALGFVSAVFDNIPLTKLALTQGGYDWGMLAYTVGFGGSMIWFGSSAGVAISKDYPEARNTGRYLKEGWHVALAYVIGFFALYLTVGWMPAPNHKANKDKPGIEKPVDDGGKKPEEKPK